MQTLPRRRERHQVQFLVRRVRRSPSVLVTRNESALILGNNLINRYKPATASSQDDDSPTSSDHEQRPVASGAGDA